MSSPVSSSVSSCPRPCPHPCSLVLSHVLARVLMPLPVSSPASPCPHPCPRRSDAAVGCTTYFPMHAGSCSPRALGRAASFTPPNSSWFTAVRWNSTHKFIYLFTSLFMFLMKHISLGVRVHTPNTHIPCFVTADIWQTRVRL